MCFKFHSFRAPFERFKFYYGIIIKVSWKRTLPRCVYSYRTVLFSGLGYQPCLALTNALAIPVVLLALTFHLYAWRISIASLIFCKRFQAIFLVINKKFFRWVIYDTLLISNLLWNFSLIYKYIYTFVNDIRGLIIIPL